MIADRVVDVQGGAGTNSASATVIVEMHDVFIWTRTPVINESKATDKGYICATTWPDTATWRVKTV